MQQPFDLSSPDGELPIIFNWKPWLGAAAIAQYIPDMPPGLVLLTSSEDDGRVVFWVAHDSARPTAPGSERKVWCRVVTNEVPPRKDSRYIIIRTRA